MTENKQIYPRFISRKPIGEDQFEGKSQKKIADSIIQQIEDKDNSLKMIGLEGDWGTGKSNVIEIVKNHFSLLNNIRTVFFVYDVWGHQEDLQRKSILNELVNSLSKDFAIIKNDWIDKVKKLTGTVVEHKTTSTPRISLGMILSFLIIILTPLCGVVADSKADNDFKGKIFWFLIPCIALLGLYVIYIIVALFNIKNKGDRKWYLYLFYDTAIQFFSVYKDKEIESTNTEYTNESNPSVLDFNNFMNELSSTLKKNKKHLVIIFDNMDRLPVEKVKDLWSSIHTFFSEKNYDSITTIVTFDRKHINQAFGDKKNPTIGNDYINKTFDIVYRVSLPILSDWKHFFKHEWEYAFGNEDSYADLNEIVMIFENLSRNFTPRAIISFINDCVSIRMICSKTIADKYIALFVLSKIDLFNNDTDENTQILDQKLIEKTYLGSLEYLYSDDENLERNMAALVYQIEPENALSVVYTKKLQDAINTYKETDTSSLDIIQKSSVFMDILDSAINNLTDIQKSIKALDYLKNAISEERKQAIWDNFYAKAKKIGLEKLTDTKQISEVQNILINNITPKKDYIQTYVLIENRDLEKFIPSDYWEKLQSLKKCCEENSLDFHSLLPQIQLDADKFIKFLSLSEDTYENYKISSDLSGLDEYLSEKDINELKTLLAVKFYKERVELKSFKEKLTEFLKTKANTEEYLINTVRLLNDLNKEGEYTDISIIPQNILMTIGGTINKDSEYLADFCAIRFAYTNPQIQYGQIPLDQNILNKSNEELALKIAEHISSYISLSTILLKLEVYRNLPVYRELCKQVIENDNLGGNRANINSLMSHFVFIVTTTGCNYKTLLERLNPWNKNFNEEDIDIGKLLDLDFINACNETNNELSKKCLSAINNFFDNYDINKWNTAFSNFAHIGVNQALLSHYKWSNDAYTSASNTLL